MDKFLSNLDYGGFPEEAGRKLLDYSIDLIKADNLEGLAEFRI